MDMSNKKSDNNNEENFKQNDENKDDKNYLIFQEIQKINKYLIEESLSMTNKIKLIENNLRESDHEIYQFIKILNDQEKLFDEKFGHLKKIFEESENEKLTLQGKSSNIWDASAKGLILDVILYYIKNPENINKKDGNFYNWTPLHYATDRGRLNIVIFLILSGVEIDAVTVNQVTPLHSASATGDVSIIRFLLDKGANINHQDEFKMTSLFFAIYYNHLHIVKLLIQRGGNKMIKDGLDRTPLDYAKILQNTDSKYKPIVDYLKSN